ncbi:MAG: Fur-regulated basic protein FbpA [Bacillus sp. (in: firmicutes)]
MELAKIIEERKNRIIDFLNRNGVYKLKGDARHLYEYSLTELEVEYRNLKRTKAK